MSVVSGIATANGVSSLLNGRFDASSDQKRIRDAALPQPSKALRIDASISRIVERMSSSLDTSASKHRPAQNTAITEGSGKYMRFVDAVQALRLNTVEASRMSPARVEELKEAAEEVFDIRNGIPREQRPAEVFEEQRIREAEREATEQAERARVEDAERAAKAVSTDEAELRPGGHAARDPVGAVEHQPGTARSADGVPDAQMPRMPDAKLGPVPAAGQVKSAEPAIATTTTGTTDSGARPGSTETATSLSTRV